MNNNKIISIHTFLISLLAIIAIGSLLIALWQNQAYKALKKANNDAMNAYIAKPKNNNGAKTNIRLNNVEFCWTDSTCALIENVLGVLAASGNNIIVDQPNSFYVKIESGAVKMDPGAFAGMLNDSIFNYPESTLRNMAVSIVEDSDNRKRLEITGSIKLLFWIPFDMRVSLAVNKNSNDLKIIVEDLDVLGVIPATWVIKIDPLNLEELLPLPKNEHLSIKKNTIFVKPFGLFPPPRIQGQLDTLSIEEKEIFLTFGDSQTGNKMLTNNGLVVSGGAMTFGDLSMSPVDIVIRDNSPESPFRFNLYRYDESLSNSTIAFGKNNQVMVTMPDLPKPN